MNTVLWTGDGSASSETGVGFQPDLVWIKQRSGTQSHYLYDAIRTATEYLQSNTAVAETTKAEGLTSFDSDGFSVGNDNANSESGYTYVAWNWKAGTTTGIAGSPSITPSSYSFSATSGFSIIQFTGTGATATLPHGLGVAPKMIIVKSASGASGWRVYHEGIGAGKALVLETTAAADTSTDYWNDTAPTSTLFTVKANSTNDNTATMMAYCFADISGYSKMGSYVGNGNADGTFVYTGFRPAFVMIKRTDSTTQWPMTDSARSPDNEATETIYANLSNAEASMAKDLLSNGFKCRTSDGDINAAGGTYIYMAFGQPIISNSGVCATAR
jgi:hypothetical protein